MIEFKELRVTPDGKTLIIDAAVKDLSYYDNVYIKSVTIYPLPDALCYAYRFAHTGIISFTFILCLKKNCILFP